MCICYILNEHKCQFCKNEGFRVLHVIKICIILYLPDHKMCFKYMLFFSCFLSRTVTEEFKKKIGTSKSILPYHTFYIMVIQEFQ